ncbi:MAG: amidohydrolase family protein [Gammaproteobacteria bacterium]|jgi:hypothetical protein|nr:amidohydrolase family protein [Gammaproteobacteria bacterium]
MNFKKLTVILTLILSLEVFANSLLIENITVIDAENPVRLNQSVFIKNGRIKAVVDPSEQMPAFGHKDRVIDGKGKFLIPGLWDAHVHLTFISEIDHETYFELFLKNGITSIRDTGAIIEKLQPSLNYLKKNPSKAPRLFYAGPLIDGKDRVYKGEEPGFPELSIGIDKNTNIEKVVNDLLEQGVTFLKSYEMLSKETYLELLQIAKKNNLRVTGHIPLSIDLEEAIDAGLGGMQHVRNMDLACSQDAPELLAQRRAMLDNQDSIAGSALRTEIHSSQRYYAIDNYDAKRCLRIIKKLAASGVFQTPTLTINTFGSRRFYADPEWRKTYQFLPEEIKLNWQKGSLNLSTKNITQNDMTFDKWSLNLVNIMNLEGVKIIAGTDTPIGYLTPGFSLHKELELLSEAGMTNKEVLHSATIAPAEFLNIQNEIGTIEEGKLADLVILNQNPLESIKNTQDIYLVIAKGIVQ